MIGWSLESLLTGLKLVLLVSKQDYVNARGSVQYNPHLTWIHYIRDMQSWTAESAASWVYRIPRPPLDIDIIQHYMQILGGKLNPLTHRK